MRNNIIAVTLLILCVTVTVASELDYLLSKASEYSPEYTLPVVDENGRPLFIVHDFNGDSLNDIAILTVVRENDVSTSATSLRDSSRLYSAGTEQPLYIMETYFQNDMAVQSVEMGRKRVLGEVELLQLSVHHDLPAAVSISFRNSDGIETHLLIYQHTGMVSRFTIQHTFHEQAVVEDINADGITDIVIARRVPEAGHGYETFLDLYELASDGYQRRGSANIVRSLLQFIAEAGDLLVAGDWEALARQTAPDQETSGSAVDSVRSMLRPVELPDDEESELLEFDPETDVVANVVYPRIMDNPFPYPYLNQVVTLAFRFDFVDKNPRLYEVRVRLSANVFVESPFTFLTWDGS